MNEPLIITQSTVKAWQHCRRCWFLGHYLKLVPVDDYKSTTNIGNLVHDGLADYYALGSDPVAYVNDLVAKALEDAPSPERARDIAKDGDMASIMVEGYLEWLVETGADYDMTQAEPERTLEAFIADGVILRGKLDARFQTRDGRFMFLEHKTVSNFADLPRFAPTAQQFLTYHLLERLTQQARGDDAMRTDGAILNMLRKVKRTARSTPPFYQRLEVHHNDTELRNHYRHMQTVAADMVLAIDALDNGADFHRVCPPSEPTRDCLYMCSFHELCLSGIMDDGSDWTGMRDALYEVGDPLARYSEADDG